MTWVLLAVYKVTYILPVVDSGCYYPVGCNSVSFTKYSTVVWFQLLYQARLS